MRPEGESAFESAFEIDLPLHEAPPRADALGALAPSPAPAGSGRGMAAGLLVIGLLAGFAAGFAVGQRMAVPALPGVVEVPRTAPGLPAAPPALVGDPEIAPLAETPEPGAAPR